VYSTSFRLGYKYLKSNRGSIFSFTTVLAILGLTIGISSLIVVTSVMNGFEKELEDRILGVLPHSVIIKDNKISNYKKIIEDIKYKNNKVIEATPYINMQGLVSTSLESKGISIIGIDIKNEKKMSILPEYMLVGDLANLNKENSIIIGSILAANIGAYIGDTINITTTDIKTTIIGSYPRSVNLEVVGVYELKTEIDQYMTLVSHKTAQKIKKYNENDTQSIRLKTVNLFDIENISNTVLMNMNDSNFSYISWKKTHGTLFEAIKFEKLLITLMLSLIVTVASILVLSTVIMTVKSKEREIGILLTIGASGKQIISIFFAQGIIVSLIGIISGIFLGFLIIFNLNNFINLIENIMGRSLLDAYFINYFPYYINYKEILFICLISFIISLSSSLIPSVRASKLNPVEILRHE